MRPHTSLGFIKLDLEAKVKVGNKCFSPVIDPSVEIGIEIGTTITTEVIIGPTIGIGPETLTDMTIEGITISPMRDRIIIS